MSELRQHRLRLPSELTQRETLRVQRVEEGLQHRADFASWRAMILQVGRHHMVSNSGRCADADQDGRPIQTSTRPGHSAQSDAGAA